MSKKKKPIDPVMLGLVILLFIGVSLVLLVSLGKTDLIVEFFKKIDNIVR